MAIGADPQREYVALVSMHGHDRRDPGPHESDFRLCVALDLAPKPGSVRHDEAEIAHLWRIYARPIDLVEDAAPDREPDPARAVRGPDGVLRAARPGRIDPRGAGSLIGVQVVERVRRVGHDGLRRDRTPTGGRLRE